MKGYAAMRRLLLVLAMTAAALPSVAPAQQGSIPGFPVERSPLEIERLAQPDTYADRVGRKFALLGSESGTMEAWAYPLKLLRNFELSFYIGSSTEPIRGRDIVRFVNARPEATTLTYTYQSFTIRATYVTPVREPGALILLDVDATEPLTIVCSFLPVLQPMWPAGLGGQYARWDDGLHAYLISEPTRKNHGFIGSPCAEGMSYSPAHMLSDAPSQFRIRVSDSLRGRFIPIAITGGKGDRDSVRAAYTRLLRDPEALYRATLSYYRNLDAATMGLRTPSEELNRAFGWGKAAYDNLFVENPDLGAGMIAGLGPSGTGGRPGFGWFFGGDTYINALSMDGYGATGTVRDALAFTRRWQREDGKMPHELSQAAGYVDWFKNYPYAYIHGDTSPWYIVAVEDYVRSTGDTAFFRESWPSLLRAFHWSRATDKDGDGLMDNRSAGLGASEYGSLTEVQSDIYTAAVWVRALQAMENLASYAGDDTVRRVAAPLREKAARAFDEKFWDEEHAQYAYAFDPAGHRVPLVSPWSSVGLMWGLGTPSRSALSLEKINSADLSTDWGTRSIGISTPLFEPLNYNYGAVWPFLTSWVAAAQYRHHQVLQGFASLMTSVRHTFDNGAGVVTEVFSGYQNVWPREAVAHQGFCTAGVMLPAVRGLLGLDGDALRGTLAFSPAFPADWDTVRVTSYRTGRRSVDLTTVRTLRRVELIARVSTGGALDFRFAPTLSPGTVIGRVTVNGLPATCVLDASPQYVRPLISIPLKDSVAIAIDITPGLEILPPRVTSRTGDTNAGLKIVASELRGTTYAITVEGLSGREYLLGVANPGLISSVRGGHLRGTEIAIPFPDERPGAFVRKDVVIVLKDSTNPR
jgi:glycogen debranching enzyme